LHVATIDQGFVRAPPERVWPLISDPTGYPQWWPRVRSRDGTLLLPILGTVSPAIDVVEDGVDVIVRIDGSRVRGHLQWHLNEFKDGTIVYVGTDVETRRRWTARRVLRHRASVRAALIALKERLEDR
jgi:hypothetical protein